MTGTLICDEDGLYDPRNFNDRLLLGTKGQMSEAELHFIRARLRGGILSKARRGELITPLPVGLVYDAAGHVILDPDTAVRGALAHLFATFEATGSASACVKAFNAAGLCFPWRHLKGPRKGEIDWKPLQHHTVLRVLHNPRYAGCFTYGRHGYHQQPGGKMTSRLLPREEWISFIPGAHPGYITPGQYDANRDRLTANAAAHGRDRVTGPPREGTALLQGIIICGRCGGRMTVRYHQRGDQHLPTYVCQRDGIANGHRICTTIPGHSLDERISMLLIETLTPLAIEAALTVQAELQHRADEADALRAAHVERARYHADLARRRYLAGRPRQPARRRHPRSQLEHRPARPEPGPGSLRQSPPATPPAAHRYAKARIQQLITDLPAIWNDPLTPARERKRIARLLLTDVTASRTSHTITAHVRLAGGQDHTLRLPMPQSAWELRQTSPQVAAVDGLPGHHTHAQIADILNTRGMLSGEGRPFHHLMIMRIRDHYQLRNREQRLRDAGMLTLAEIAALLGVSTGTVKAWYHAGLITGHPFNDKGQCLYPPPGENPPARAQGRKLSKRRSLCLAPADSA